MATGKGVGGGTGGQRGLMGTEMTQTLLGVMAAPTLFCWVVPLNPVWFGEPMPPQ